MEHQAKLVCHFAHNGRSLWTEGRRKLSYLACDQSPQGASNSFPKVIKASKARKNLENSALLCFVTCIHRIQAKISRNTMCEQPTFDWELTNTSKLPRRQSTESLPDLCGNVPLIIHKEGVSDLPEPV
jgi:hypothetical protein